MKWLKTFILLVFAVFGLLCLLLIIATMTDFRPGPAEKVETRGISPDIKSTDSIFTILSWNLGYFGLGKECDFFYDGGRMTRPSESDYLYYSGQALNYLSHEDKPDFCFFQEVDMKSRRSYFDDQVAKLCEVFPEYESAFAVNYLVGFVPVPLRDPLGRVTSGLLSFSSFRTSESRRHAFPGGFDWPKRLFMPDRCFLLSRLALPGGKELVMINTHNEAFDDGSQRNQQIAVLKNLMLQEYEKGNFVVTGGDWNQNPVGYLAGSESGSELPGIFSNGDISRLIEPQINTDFFPPGWQWVFDPAVPTNRDVNQVYVHGTTPATIIDFFVVSPNVTVVEIKTEDLGFEWSDHQPVRMTFKIN